MSLLHDIETFIVETGIAPTALGVGATGDRHLVRQMRQGREVFSRTEKRIRDFMERYRGAHEVTSTATANSGSTGNIKDLSAGTNGVAAGPGDATVAHAEAGGAASLSGGCEGYAA
ncbi:hypothetical protein FHW96_000209 [Novosphingobium sp. SG751A]|uniref:hypothetical protein n=1 Tax=Novosphingobium sp. SG751A TaxID=2587000 RepID=UPI0015575A88|nr:hypothetical protein [Novosphingobium sp. SG751A]NOW44082.1 hypothetical protein [Novosphingobium sp. SG751A]